MRVQRILVLLLMFLGWNALAAARDLALIANKANRTQEMSLPDLVKVCKGQTGHWPDGKPVSLIVRDPSSLEMKIALEKIYGLSIDEVKGVIASANHGRAEHPAIVVAESDEAVVKKVESSPGAVGLVDVYSITGGVTVLKIDGKLPLEPGYALHGN